MSWYAEALRVPIAGTQGPSPTLEKYPTQLSTKLYAWCNAVRQVVFSWLYWKLVTSVNYVLQRIHWHHSVSLHCLLLVAVVPNCFHFVVRPLTALRPDSLHGWHPVTVPHWNSWCSWEWSILSQMFAEAACTPRCVIVYTCGHESDWKTLIEWFGWVSEYFWQHSVYAYDMYITSMMEPGSTHKVWMAPRGIQMMEAKAMIQPTPWPQGGKTYSP